MAAPPTSVAMTLAVMAFAMSALTMLAFVVPAAPRL
ncbi:hypothetical protein FVEN_g12991 [Fusarium venenatum]|nr:hypothetical protein FVEN_g12991 [Fusarium venenatum]